MELFVKPTTKLSHVAVVNCHIPNLRIYWLIPFFFSYSSYADARTTKAQRIHLSNLSADVVRARIFGIPFFISIPSFTTHSSSNAIYNAEYSRGRLLSTSTCHCTSCHSIIYLSLVFLLFNFVLLLSGDQLNFMLWPFHFSFVFVVAVAVIASAVLTSWNWSSIPVDVIGDCHSSYAELFFILPAIEYSATAFR